MGNAKEKFIKSIAESFPVFRHQLLITTEDPFRKIVTHSCGVRYGME